MRTLLIFPVLLCLSACTPRAEVESLVKDLSATGQIGANLNDPDRYDSRSSQQGNGNVSTQQVITTQDPALVQAIEQVATLAVGLAGVWVLAFVAVMMRLGTKLGMLGRELSGLREDTRQNTLAVERVPQETAREISRINPDQARHTADLKVV